MWDSRGFQGGPGFGAQGVAFGLKAEGFELSLRASRFKEIKEIKG